MRSSAPPMFAVRNPRHRGFTNAKRCSDLSVRNSRRKHLAHIGNVGSGKFCARMRFASGRNAPPSFRHRIVDVVCIRSEKQVSRVAACWCVACVQHAKARIEIPVSDLKRDSGGNEIFCPHLESTISAGIDAGLPEPAGISVVPVDVNLRPESREIVVGEWGDDSMRSSHCVLQSRTLWLEPSPGRNPVDGSSSLYLTRGRQ